MRIYDFHHVDGGSFYRLSPEAARDEGLREIKTAFKLAGWEGDGDVEVFIIPPFICGNDNICSESYEGYHVKQSNNGTSFVAVPSICNIKMNTIARFKFEGDIDTPEFIDHSCSGSLYEANASISEQDKTPL